MALPPARGPLYLARMSYRQRRLRDAACMLPVAGAILWLLPVLYLAPSTGLTVIYLFGIWFILILAAHMLARRMDGAADEDAPVQRDRDSGP